MPYARRYTKRTTGRSYPRKRAAYRKAVIPRKKKTAKSYLRTQGYRQLRLQKQVRFLMNARWGPKQMNYHVSDRMIPLASQPCCFDATDFTALRVSATTGTTISEGCKIWQVDTVGTGLTTAGRFNPLFYGSGNPFWDSQNADIPDGGVYFPTFAKYVFHVKGRNNVDDTWIDIKLLAHKKGTIVPQGSAFPGSAIQRMMPYAMMHMQYLADYSNKVNPEFFKIYASKRIYLNSQTSITAPTPGTTANQQGVIQTTGNTKFAHFKIRPKKPRTQLTTYPALPGIPNSTAPGATVPDDVESGSYGVFNVPLDQPLWFLISVNDRTALDGDSVEVKVSRTVYWRDTGNGSAAVNN